MILIALAYLWVRFATYDTHLHPFVTMYILAAAYKLMNDAFRYKKELDHDHLLMNAIEVD